MKIRRATKEDIKAISDLATKTFVEAFGDTFTPAELKERLEKTRSVNFYTEALMRDTVLFAEEDEQIVGYVQYGDVTFHLGGVTKDDQELQRVYALRKYQNKGIGKALIEAALSDPKLQNARNIYLDVWTDNVRAQKLYKSYGFAETGYINDGDLIMVKRNTRVKD